jgi:hypothetical protein
MISRWDLRAWIIVRKSLSRIFTVDKRRQKNEKKSITSFKRKGSLVIVLNATETGTFMGRKSREITKIAKMFSHKIF